MPSGLRQRAQSAAMGTSGVHANGRRASGRVAWRPLHDAGLLGLGAAVQAVQLVGQARQRSAGGAGGIDALRLGAGFDLAGERAQFVGELGRQRVAEPTVARSREQSPRGAPRGAA